MSILITALKTEADALLQSADVANELNAPTRFQRVREALAMYSQSFPDIYTEDVTGDGGAYYPLTGASAALSAWKEDVSNIIRIEYPAATIASNDMPQYLEPGSWDDDYEVSGVTYVYLRNANPQASESFRVTYSTQYQWSASSTTTAVNQVAHGFSADDYVRQDSAGDWEAATSLTGSHQVTVVADADNFTAAALEINAPGAHFDALCNLVACRYCHAIAAKYSRTSDSTINVDAANHPTRADQFRTQANAFCATYRQMVGLEDPGGGAAGAVGSGKPASQMIDLDTRPRYPRGRRYLFHRRR